MLIANTKETEKRLKSIACPADVCNILKFTFTSSIFDVLPSSFKVNFRDVSNVFLIYHMCFIYVVSLRWHIYGIKILAWKIKIYWGVSNQERKEKTLKK